jgi:hypothetical protein
MIDINGIELESKSPLSFIIHKDGAKARVQFTEDESFSKDLLLARISNALKTIELKKKVIKNAN